MGKTISLADMQSGSKGRILEIQGGYGILSRLNALGIMQGVEIIKVIAQLIRGPVILRHGNTQVAIGFGMASKILVQLADTESK